MNLPQAADSPGDLQVRSDRALVYPLCVLLMLFFILMVRTAWVGDDAFIGVRTIDNFVNGYGLRWNVSERVQVFTHPLWLFLVSAVYFFTREAFITTIVLSIALSMGAVLIVVRRLSTSTAASIAAVAALISSKAFMDYTTSGLENALSFVLVALFCFTLLRCPSTLRQFRILILIAALSAFNRLDSILLFAPAIAWVAWQLWRRNEASLARMFGSAVLYSLPLWGWLIFATIYFGFMFPNTYYAKMYTGVPKPELLLQGLLYYANSISTDPVTLIIIGVAILVAVATRDLRVIAAAAGIGLYLLYIINIGGDFMMGRFFSVPVFFAVVLLVHTRLPDRSWHMLAVLFVSLGLLGQSPTLLSSEHDAIGLSWVPPEKPVRGAVMDHRGIADERAAYFQGGGLLPVLRHDRTVPTFNWVAMGRAAREKGRHISFFSTPGFFGYYAGPAVHIVDTFALGDPVLSKLPIAGTDWRIGHYRRRLPAGYLETIQTGKNKLKDPKIRELYRVTEILCRKRIWSADRFMEIAKMNLGFYNEAIRSIDVSDSTEAPENGTEALWPSPTATVERGSPLLAQVTAGWPQESGSEGAFWWANKDARVEFFAPKAARDLGVILPYQILGRDVQLEFRVNGKQAVAQPLPPSPSSAFARVRLPGPWKSGANVLEVIGSGEAVNPPSDDPRKLLFAIGQARWE